jgi:MFS family permease
LTGNAPQKAVNRIALSRAVTFSGGNAAYIALLALLYEETGSATFVALGALASFAVPALVSPVAGWIGDRFDRRRVMVASEILGAACFLLMATLPAGAVLLLLLRVAASLVAAPLVPATAAALPGVVGHEETLPAANARLAAAGITGGLVGPLIAAVLLLAVDPASVFVFNAATFVVSAALLLSIDGDFRPTRNSEESGRVIELVAGFRYLGHHRLLRPVTMAYAIVFIGVGITAPAELALSTDFGAGATGFAALACAFAVGGIAGAQLGSRGISSLPVSPTAILAAASGALAFGFLAVGFAPFFAAALAGMAVVGVADGLWLVAHENLVQRVTPDSIRSRVFAGSEAVYLAGISLGLIGAGGLIAAYGAAGTFKLGAVGSILACLFLVGTASSSPQVPKFDPARRAPVLATPTPATATED